MYNQVVFYIFLQCRRTKMVTMSSHGLQHCLYSCSALCQQCTMHLEEPGILLLAITHHLHIYVGLMLESSLIDARSMPELLAWPYSAIHVVCDASVTLTKSICVHRVPGDCISVDTALPSLKLWIYHLHSLTSKAY